MANDDKASKPDQQPPEGERRFSQKQYDLLKSCSDKQDMNEWNQWRQEHPDLDIELDGSPFGKVYFKGAYLYSGSRLGVPELTGNVYLRGADLRRSNLEEAVFLNAHLEGAKLQGSSLKGAHFMGASVDGNTNIWKVRVNRFTRSTAKDWFFTDFSGVPLQSVAIDPATKQLIEYNIRRKYWYKWINQKDWGEITPGGNIERGVLNKIPRSLIHLFFWTSDYGRSTGRVIGSFFVLALIFANIYYHWARIAPPGIVENLFVDRNGIPIEWWIAPLRTLYFSIVTMTTLGFGDMYANAHSIFGHILLSFQVILGYVLLGALVTRFAVLFTAGGPAGKFAPTKTK